MSQKSETGQKIKGFFSNIGEKIKNLFKPKSGFESAGSSEEPAWKRILTIALLVVLFAAVICLAVFTVGIYTLKWDNQPAQVMKRIVPFPAAIVGFQTVSIYHVEEEAGHINHFYKKSGADQSTIPSLAVIKNQVLDRLIEDQIIGNLARRYDIGVANAEVEEQFDKIVKENGGEKKVETLLSDLYDISVSQFKDLIKKQLQREEFIPTKEGQVVTRWMDIES